jgi:hypothetical protein
LEEFNAKEYKEKIAHLEKIGVKDWSLIIY